MARFDFLEVLCTLRDTGMVPVFYHRDAAVTCQVLKACYEGGVRAFEFTDRGDFACEVFASLVKYAGKECPEMALGVGSVTDAPTAASYLNCGADFVVGPCFVQSPGCPLRSRLRDRCGDRGGPGGGLQPGEALSGGMCGRTFVREECPRTAPARADYGDGRRGTYGRESPGVV